MAIELHSHTIEKLKAVVKQIEFLLLSDFPHTSSEAALCLFKNHFEEQVLRVEKAHASGDRSVLMQACATANSRIGLYLPLLGFLLRSTNVRNNFECYDALLQIAQQLIGSNANIVISSEWQISPLTYPLTVPVLPGYVLLGMPATESSNALILPLAGHELGHSIWLKDNLEGAWASKVQSNIYDYIVREQVRFCDAFPVYRGRQIDGSLLSSDMFITLIVDDISKFTLSQMEETYCDAIGLKIFGESFAHAFHYLLAPGLGEQRALHYPTLPARARFMVAYGGLDFGALGYPDYPSEFQELTPRLSKEQVFISRAADDITIGLAGALYAEAAFKVASSAPNLISEKSHQDEILAMFKRGIPSRQPRSLPDILNAGWQFVREGKQTDETDRRPIFEWTSELVLKSIEVLEFRRHLHA